MTKLTATQRKNLLKKGFTMSRRNLIIFYAEQLIKACRDDDQERAEEFIKLLRGIYL